MTMREVRGFSGASFVLRIAAAICFLSGAQSGVARAADAAAGPAADDADQGLEEIVVTARKQTESFMKVPVTAAVLTTGDLNRNQITDIHQLTGQIPSVRFDETAGGGGGTLTIRGIGSSTSDNGVDNTVAMVFDGLQTSKGYFTKVGFLDLGQVEVLKGPQALFYGKNSPGGVVAMTSAAPTDKLEGYARAGYTTGIDERRFEGAISGPLGGNFRARLALSTSDMDGWIKNTVQDTANPFFGSPGAPATLGPAPYDKNWSQETMGRLTVDYTNSDFTAALRVQGIRYLGVGRSGDGEIVNCGGPQKPDFLGVPDPYNDCQLNYRTAVGAIPVSVRGTDVVYPAGQVSPYAHFNAYTAALTMNYSHSAFDITSVTGYMRYRYLATHESATSFGYGTNGVDEHWHQLSEEVRLVTKFDGPLNFSGGLYYDQAGATNHGPNLILPLPADPRNGLFWTYIYDGATTAQTYSAFAQARWKFMQDLEFDVGARYSRDKRTGNVADSFLNENAVPLGFLEDEGVHIQGDRTYNNFSPEATLTWTATPDTIVFGSFRAGYKPGESGNPNIVSKGLTTDTLFYKTEKVSGFELGFKSSLLNNTLRLTGAAFTYRYKDLQVSNFDSTKFVLVPLAGDMSTKGFELAANWRPLPPLRFNGALAYTKARWTDFNGVACYATGSLPRPDVAPFCDPATQTENLTGMPKFRSPDWSGNVGFAYELPVWSSIRVELNGNMSFVTHFNAQENDSPYAEQGGYALYDGGITATTEDGHLQFALMGKNLSDKRYFGATYDQANALNSATVFGPVSQPRTALFQVTYRY
jgi:iron complex outermembrane receptor protein